MYLIVLCQCVVVRMDWKPYEAELQEVFGFDRDSDPDPSEWFPTEDFYRFKPYLEAVRTSRAAAERADGARKRREKTHDHAQRKRVIEDQTNAAEKMDAANKQQGLFNRGELGEIRHRAETRLGVLRHGLDRPPDLSFL